MVDIEGSEFKYYIKIVSVIIVILISLFFIAPLLGFDIMRYLSSPPNLANIFQPKDFSVEKQFEGELNHDGMILERDAGEDNVTRVLEERSDVTSCSNCNSCSGIDLNVSKPGFEAWKCSECATCSGTTQFNRFNNCWGCNVAIGNCSFCEDITKETKLCKELEKCIYNFYGDIDKFYERNGCTLMEISHTNETFFNLNDFINLLKDCDSKSIIVNKGKNVVKELCYFNSSSVSYYDFQRPVDFYLKYSMQSVGSAITNNNDLKLTPFYKEGGETFPKYRIYIAINGRPNYVYTVESGKYPLRDWIGRATGLSAKIGEITTDENGFGYEEFLELPEKTTWCYWLIVSLVCGDENWKETPEKYPLNGVNIYGKTNNAEVPINTSVTFYDNEKSNGQWSNDLRYSNCNFESDIEPYLKSRPWWVYNQDNLNTSWIKTTGNQNSSIKVFYDSSVAGGGNSYERGNINIKMGRFDASFLNSCKFDLYVCSQDSFTEMENEKILSLNDFFENFNPMNTFKTIEYDADKEIILYNFFEIYLDKNYTEEEIKSAIKTGFRNWEQGLFSFYSPTSGLEWFRNNDGIYMNSWNDISNLLNINYDDDCWSDAVLDNIKNRNERIIIGNCPNNLCEENLKVRVAFKYIKPIGSSPFKKPLYPTITFCTSP